MSASSDLVGVWEVALSDGIHRVEFEHGTTTGKRIIRVDGKVYFNKNNSIINFHAIFFFSRFRSLFFFINKN